MKGACRSEAGGHRRGPRGAARKSGGGRTGRRDQGEARAAHALAPPHAAGRHHDRGRHAIRQNTRAGWWRWWGPAPARALGGPHRSPGDAVRLEEESRASGRGPCREQRKLTKATMSPSVSGRTPCSAPSSPNAADYAASACRRRPRALATFNTVAKVGFPLSLSAL